MGRRSLDITKDQARALLEAAEQANGIIEVKFGETFVRLIPANLAIDKPAIDLKTISTEKEGPKKWA